MFERVRDKLSILWLDRFLGRYKGKYEYKNDELYLFSSETPLAGMALASYEIAINESIVEEGDEETLEMVYLHEKQHLKDHVLSVLTGISQMMVLSPVSLVLNFVFLSTISIFSLIGFYPGPLETDLILKVISADLLISFAAIIISQIGEMRAEMNAFRELGPKSMKEAKEDLREQVAEPGLVRSISVRLTHPPLRTVEKVYNLMNRR